MRRLILLPLSILAASSLGLSGLQAAPTVVRIWPQYRPAESFTRIREFFNGGASTGGETVRRSREADRAGYYFLVRLDNTEAAIPGARLELSLILPGTGEPRVLTFPADVPVGEHVFNLGVTGADWPGAAVRPIAWRFVLRSASGTEITQAQSFLWSLPRTDAQ